MCGGTKTYRGIEGKRFDRLTRTLFFSLACALTLLIVPKAGVIFNCFIQKFRW